MEALSNRQRQMLEFIGQHITLNDRPPTNREIGSRSIRIRASAAVAQPRRRR